MDAGVPIKKMLSGIAMGMVQSSSDSVHILSDITGTEDSYGLMDLKVTGSEDGIMALQMDVKIEGGLKRELMQRAFEQSKKARLHILERMKTVLDGPRSSIPEFAPQVTMFKVEPDKIGGIIGPAGKTIKEIIAQTNAQIDISDDGTVRIYAKDAEEANRAKKWVSMLGGNIPVGEMFEGIVRRITPFGLFVELVPGKDGLVHISTIDREKQASLERTYPVNTPLKVKVTAYEKETGRVRLVAPELERQGGRRTS